MPSASYRPLQSSHAAPETLNEICCAAPMPAAEEAEEGTDGADPLAPVGATTDAPAKIGGPEPSLKAAPVPEGPVPAGSGPIAATHLSHRSQSQRSHLKRGQPALCRKSVHPRLHPPGVARPSHAQPLSLLVPRLTNAWPFGHLGTRGVSSSADGCFLPVIMQSSRRSCSSISMAGSAQANICSRSDR